MPRPLRIEFENAWYHVMNRGTARQNIFNSESDRMQFLKVLKEATFIFKIEIHAYCLMGNHYHLQIKTPYANLGRVMRHIDGVYTQRFNRSSKRDGPLFRGRYKAIVIDKDNYLLQVNRYIHLNPIDASMVDDISQYRWSSYLSYIDPKIKPSWLFTDEILMLMDRNDPINAYKKFIQDGIDLEMKKFYQKTATPCILGDVTFKNQLLSSLDIKRVQPSLTDYRRIRELPKTDFIIEVCFSNFNIKTSDLCNGKVLDKKIRNIAIYLCRKLAIEKLSCIADRFKFKSISTICDIVKSVEISRKEDNEINKLINMLEKIIQQNYHRKLNT